MLYHQGSEYERPNEILQKEGENIFSIDIYFYVKVKGSLELSQAYSNY